MVDQKIHVFSFDHLDLDALSDFPLKASCLKESKNY
jgi:hypothetical protein